MSDKPRAWNSTLPVPSKPLDRGSGLERKAPLNPVNSKRRKKRHREQYGSKDYQEYVRGLSCIVGEGCEGKIELAHVKSRGAGGKAENLVPLCTLHHREQHTAGVRTFQDEHGLDLDLEAAFVWQAWTMEVDR